MSLKACGIAVHRLNNGRPIIAPTERWWESSVTFNPAAVYVPRSAVHDPILAAMLGAEALSRPDLADGAVAVHYRARPTHDPESRWHRSFVGLAIFTPDFRLLKRFDEPVLLPDPDETAPDHLGCEDCRITRIDGHYYMAYCGVARTPRGTGICMDETLDFDLLGNLCMARSRDLVHWQRLGMIEGNIQSHHNKDVVLFPDTFDGHYHLMHRPYNPTAGTNVDYAMHLARSRSPEGPWEEMGMVLHSWQNPSCRESWVGAGTVPIPLSPGRYLVIYHTGNWINAVDRQYDVDAAIFDLSRWSADDPEAIVEKRLERIMVPTLPHEKRAPTPDSIANVVFPCGSYEYNGDIYIVYGAADTYVMAAKVKREELIDAVMKSDHPSLRSRKKVQVKVSARGRGERTPA